MIPEEYRLLIYVLDQLSDDILFARWKEGKFSPDTKLSYDEIYDTTTDLPQNILEYISKYHAVKNTNTQHDCTHLEDTVTDRCPACEYYDILEGKEDFLKDLVVYKLKNS